MQIRFTLIHVVIDVCFMGFLCAGFYAGMAFGMQFMPVDVWFTRTLVGVIGLTISIALFNWLKVTILFFMKSCSIYAVCFPDCDSMHAALKGVLSRFDRVVEINIFNKLLRSALGELTDIITDLVSDSEDSQISFLVGIVEESKLGVLVKIGRRYATKTFDFVDECILGYCYQNPQLGLVEAAKQGVTIFLENSVKIVGKLFTISMLETVLRVLFYVAVILALLIFRRFNIMSLVVFYVIARGIAFIIEDAVLEPLLMSAVIKEFNTFTYVENSEMESVLRDKVPGYRDLCSFKMAGVKKSKNAGGDDGSCEDCENSKGSERNAVDLSMDDEFTNGSEDGPAN